MAENSKIQWTTHTWNPWRGCTKISAGCANCYAETMSGRNPGTLGVWGPNGTRIVASEVKWREPVKWNETAELAAELWESIGGDRSKPGTMLFEGTPCTFERPRVFCASLADVFEDWSGPMMAAGKAPVFLGKDYRASSGDNRLSMDDVRERLFFLIRDTPNLDWLLLTKRPENILATFDRLDVHDLAETMPHVWLGTTVEDRKARARIDLLRECPAAIRFLSCEPLLEDLGELDLTGIHWVIVGGESGGKPRPFDVAWAIKIIRQCREQSVAVFVKQLGAFVVDRNDAGFDATAETFDGGPNDGQPTDPRAWPDMPDIEEDLDGTRDGYQGAPVRVRLIDRKGGNPVEWPLCLQVREFPKAVPA